MAVKFTPAVDGHNRASRLSALVPLSVDHHTGIAAPLVGGNGRRFAVLSHPQGATSVSLRASARDTAGNSVTQTVVDAFLLK